MRGLCNKNGKNGFSTLRQKPILRSHAANLKKQRANHLKAEIGLPIFYCINSGNKSHAKIKQIIVAACQFPPSIVGGPIAATNHRTGFQVISAGTQSAIVGLEVNRLPLSVFGSRHPLKISII